MPIASKGAPRGGAVRLRCSPFSVLADSRQPDGIVWLFFLPCSAVAYALMKVTA